MVQYYELSDYSRAILDIAFTHEMPEKKIDDVPEYTLLETFTNIQF